MATSSITGSRRPPDNRCTLPGYPISTHTSHGYPTPGQHAEGCRQPGRPMADRLPGHAGRPHRRPAQRHTHAGPHVGCWCRRQITLLLSAHERCAGACRNGTGFPAPADLPPTPAAAPEQQAAGGNLERPNTARPERSRPAAQPATAACGTADAGDADRSAGCCCP